MIVKQIFLAIFCEYWTWRFAEASSLFTSTAELESLVETNSKIASDLRTYVTEEKKRLSTLTKYLNKFKNEYEIAKRDKSAYVGNPINAFYLIKRLTVDLQDIERIVYEESGSILGYFQRPTLRYKDLKYPTDDDLKGAVQALIRLHNIYQINAQEMSQGISDVIHSSNITAGDCYDLAYMLYDEYQYQLALYWMFETLRKYEDGDRDVEFTKIEIMEFITECYYGMQDYSNTLKWTEKTLTLHPWHDKMTDLRDYLLYYREDLVTCPDDSYEVEIMKQEKRLEDWEELFAETCRGDMEINRKVSKKLYCRYFDNHPFFKIAPVKMEMLYVEPDVSMFYDVISEKEMDYFKNMSIQRLHRSENWDFRISQGAWLDEKESEVVASFTRKWSKIIGLDLTWSEKYQAINYGIGGHYSPHCDFFAVHGDLKPAEVYGEDTEEVDYRISKGAWLSDAASEIVRRVSRRLSQLTGLALSSSDDYQTINYGIGGHYSPHHDYTRVDEDEFGLEAQGNRIATTLFYDYKNNFYLLENTPFNSLQISDVAKGGATVFPKLGLTVFPIKGAALFWRNLHSSGYGNNATLHAACPVLFGSKWVITKWIREKGQELQWPCDLKFQKEGLSRPILKPFFKDKNLKSYSNIAKY